MMRTTSPPGARHVPVHFAHRSYRRITDLLMDGKLGWLADGAMDPVPPRYRDWQRNDYEHPARTADDRAAAASGEIPKRSSAAA